MPHREVRAGDIGEGRQDRALADAVEVVLGRWTPPACHVDLHERRQTVVERAMLGAVAGLRLEGPCYDIGEPTGFAVIVERPEVLEAVDLRLVLGPGRAQALMRFGEIPDRKSTRLKSSHSCSHRM